MKNVNTITLENVKVQSYADAFVPLYSILWEDEINRLYDDLVNVGEEPLGYAAFAEWWK